MTSGENREAGFWFALPRLVARLGGRKVRRAEWSSWEAYGLGLLVFGMGCVSLAHALLDVVRPWPLRSLCLLLMPFAIWIACLFVYFVVWLLAGLLRRLGLYSARTNNPLQNFIIMAIVTGLAGSFLREDSGWLRSLGDSWLGLVGLNFLAIVTLKVIKEAE